LHPNDIFKILHDWTQWTCARSVNINAKQLASISLVYHRCVFPIVDVPTLFKYSIIYSTRFPCANLYNTTFGTFEIGKRAHINILAYDFKNRCNCSNWIWKPKIVVL
jgi:hypothetical protein